MMIGLIIPYICFSTCNCLCDYLSFKSVSLLFVIVLCDMTSVKFDNYIIFKILYFLPTAGSVSLWGDQSNPSHHLKDVLNVFRSHSSILNYLT